MPSRARYSAGERLAWYSASPSNFPIATPSDVPLVKISSSGLSGSVVKMGRSGTARGAAARTAFLAGLELACGVTATMTGKPGPTFFRAALDHVGADAAEVLMVGDDLMSDVVGGQAVGLRGVLVRTGKFLPRDLERADEAPDHVIDSFVDLPDLVVALNA